MSLASHLWPLKDETSYKDKGKILRELHKRRQTMKVLLSREDKNPKKKKNRLTVAFLNSMPTSKLAAHV